MVYSEKRDTTVAAPFTVCTYVLVSCGVFSEHISWLVQMFDNTTASYYLDFGDICFCIRTLWLRRLLVMKINEKVKMMPGYQMHVKAIWSLMYLLYILAHVDVRRIRDRHVQIDRIGIQRNKRNTDQPLSCVLAEVTEK